METLLILGLLAAVVVLGRRIGRLERDLDEVRGSVALLSGGAQRAVDEVPLPQAEPVAVAVAEAEVEEAVEPPLISPSTAEPELSWSTAQESLFEAEPATAHFEETKAAPAPRRLSFEELFGRRLPIWAGGITLAVAGFLIVKYSIEAGLISPALRVIAGLLFGIGLIAGAELARRRAEWVRDPRVAQALSGAGIASLYGSVLVAANLYGLIGGGAAMVGMALITGLALFLATRFGAPSALLGLAGGLAAPALIGSAEPNVPLLSLYLALAVGGLTALSRTQRWAWLGVSALVGGFGWGLLLLLGGALDVPSRIALGLYMLVIGLLLPAVAMAGDGRARVQLIAGAAAGVQLGALVATGDFGAVEWVLFGLLSVAVQVLRRRDPRLALLPPLGLLIGFVLIAAWPDPSRGELALVLAGAALIYGAPAVWRLWRPDGELIEAGQLAALAIGGLLLPLLHFYRPSDEAGFGLLALGMAAVAAGLVALGWRTAGHRADPRTVLLATASALLLSAAGVLLLSEWLHAPWVAAVAAGLLALARAGAEQRLEGAGWTVLGISLLMLFGHYATGDDVLRIAGIGSGTSWTSAARWLALAAAFGLFGWHARRDRLRALAQFIVVPLAFAGLAQVVAPAWLPLLAAALLVAVAAGARRLHDPFGRVVAGALAVLLAWALGPAGEWSVEGAMSLTGDPMLLPDVPDVRETLARLLAPAGAIAATLWLAGSVASERFRRILAVSLGVLLLIGAHSLFKHVFGIEDGAAFVALGLGERLVWAGLLLLVAAGLWRRGLSRSALVAAAAAGAHFVWYTLGLHNPLWAEQAVGGWPVVNLLLPMYGLPIALIAAAERRELVPGRWRLAAQIVQMLLVVLLAASTLRQLFHGAILVGGGLLAAENIAWSITAIALAIGFLLWGIRRRQRAWRVASLLLMLGAVAKVFLLDASGLEGLTRIASFVALGFSLIGIGWLYARQLRSEEPTAATA